MGWKGRNEMVRGGMGWEEKKWDGIGRNGMVRGGMGWEGKG